MSDFAPVRSRNEDAGLFKLALRTSILTVLTAGIYRFWARTRIRRFIWSTISVEGDALEYTGTGLEKFLGFLVAVVVLAVYLGLVQLILLWFGLHYVFRPRNPAEMIMQAAVFYLSFFAVLPLMIFARFRARRYMLARTRFRSIRFGMEGSAWGYVGRTLWYGFLTIITLGIHLPRQTFNLERYKTDHSWFGDRQFEQKGRWQDLWPATHHIYIGIAMVIVGILCLLKKSLMPLGGFLLPVGMIWGQIGYLYYRVHAFRILTNNKVLGGEVGFASDIRFGPVFGTFIKGYLLLLLIVAVVFGITSFFVVMFVKSLGTTHGLGLLVPGILSAVSYVFAFAIIWAASLALITRPIIARLANSIRIENAAALATVRQRAFDAGADAGGFADALDVGGAL